MQETIIFFEALGKILALPLSVLGGFFALLQWRRSEDWKRKEFVQQHFEKLQADVAFRLATGMMDWDKRKFRLDEFSGESDQFFFSSIENIKSALKHEGSHDLMFSHTEAVVRDIFDVFLTRLEMIVDMINSDLILYTDVKPYLSYWIDFLLGSKAEITRQKEVADLIRSFAKAYGYTCIDSLATFERENL